MSCKRVRAGHASPKGKQPLLGTYYVPGMEPRALQASSLILSQVVSPGELKTTSGKSETLLDSIQLS